jgi:hypothetical protein
MIKLIKSYKENNLSESFQSNNIKFSFVNKVDNNYYQITSPAQCREYFNEFLMQNHHPQEYKWVDVYGFSYDYSVDPYDLSATRFSMKFPSQETLGMFLDNLEFLWQVEDYNKVPRTVIQHTANKDTLLIEGDAFWNQKCILLNIYTWILKLCSLNFDLKNNTDASEVEYLKHISTPIFNKLLHSLREIQDTPSKYVDGTDKLRGAGAIHSTSGILAIKSILTSTYTNWLSSKLYQVFKQIFENTKPDHIFLQETV